MPLEAALGWRGFLRVVWWNLFHRHQDEISGNYGVVNLFAAPAPGDGREAPAPTVWHCPTLTARRRWTEDSEAVATLEANFDTILEEFLSFRDRLGAHPDDISLAGGESWSGAYFYFCAGAEDHATTAACPRTTALLQELPLAPNFGFVMFSVVAPGTHIEAHSGWSNLRLRHHLTLEIPGDEVGAITVAGEEFRWRRGECFAFDDSFDHEVNYEELAPRSVLIVDTWHPDLGEADREALSHPLFGCFGKGIPPAELGQRLDAYLYRSLRLLRRHWRYSSLVPGTATQRRLSTLRELYRVTNAWLRGMGAEYWLDCGTLLGHFREGDILEGDADVDFALLADQYDFVRAHEDELPPGFTLHESSFKFGFPKLYVTHDGWEADLYFYAREGGQVRCPTNIDFPNYAAPVPADLVFPLAEAEFLGERTTIPGSTKAYLEARFGYLGRNAVQDPVTGLFHPPATPAGHMG
jgi:aspartate beta-hydroxylase